jgi:hypothetical protein
VEGNEVLYVIQRRLLASQPDSTAADAAATAYQQVVTKMRRALAVSPAEEQLAEEHGLALGDRIRAAYPFHPALIDLMRERWAASPDFQRTRGAFRFLAACLRSAHCDRKGRALLGPADVPIEDAEVRLAFFKEVGQQADFQACLEHDFLGPNARARLVVDRRAREHSTEGPRRAAFRVATAILMYSFGGLRRPGASEGDMLPPGATEADLLSVFVGPDLDSTTIQAVLKALKETCLYLRHFSQSRWRAAPVPERLNQDPRGAGRVGAVGAADGAGGDPRALAAVQGDGGSCRSATGPVSVKPAFRLWPRSQAVPRSGWRQAGAPVELPETLRFVQHPGHADQFATVERVVALDVLVTVGLGAVQCKASLGECLYR